MGDGGASRQLKEGSRQQTSDGWALLSAGANLEDETVKEKRFEELVISPHSKRSMLTQRLHLHDPDGVVGVGHDDDDETCSVDSCSTCNELLKSTRKLICSERKRNSQKFKRPASAHPVLGQ